MITTTVDKLQRFLRKYIDYKSKVKEVEVSSLKVDKNGKYFLIVEDNPHKTKNFICNVYSITDQNGIEYQIPNIPDNPTDWNPIINIGNNNSIGVVIPGNTDIQDKGVQPFRVKYQVSGMYDQIVHGVPEEKMDYGISINLGLATKNNRYLGNEEMRKYYSGIQNIDEETFVRYVQIYDGIILFYIWQNSGYERDKLLDSFLTIINGKSEELSNIIKMEINEIAGENEENFGKQYLYCVKANYYDLVNFYYEYYQDTSQITSIETELGIYAGSLIELKGKLSGQELKKEVIVIEDDFINHPLVEGYISNVSVQADVFYTYETLQYREDFITLGKRQLVFSVKDVLDNYNISRISKVEYMGQELDYQLVGSDLYVIIEDVIEQPDFQQSIMMEYIMREFNNKYEVDFDNNTISIYEDNIYKQYVAITYLYKELQLEDKNIIEKIDIVVS